MYRFLLILITLAFWACDSSSGTDVPNEEKSSSSVTVQSSSEVPESSSSKDVVESSSSKDDVESSSEATPIESSSAATEVRSKLPFDTTGIEPSIYPYARDADSLKAYADYLEFKISDKDLQKLIFVHDTGYYCYDYTSIYDTITSTPTSYKPYIYVLSQDNDSLMFADGYYCKSTEWKNCSTSDKAIGDASPIYYKQTIVNTDTFYYAESQYSQTLVKIEDSSIYQWTVAKSVNTETTSTKKCFTSYISEEDSLAKAIGCDTIYVEKFKVKITDNENTWIFENDTCSFNDTRYYTNSGDRCEDRVNARNSKARCLQQVMKTTNVPRLCRPNKLQFEQYLGEEGLWCILDEDDPTSK